jgi:hypothetical protein
MGIEAVEQQNERGLQCASRIGISKSRSQSRKPGRRRHWTKGRIVDTCMEM